MQVELQQPWHRLEIARSHLHWQVVRHQNGELALGLLCATHRAADRDVRKRRRGLGVRCEARSESTVPFRPSDVRYWKRLSAGHFSATSNATCPGVGRQPGQELAGADDSPVVTSYVAMSP